MNKDILKGKWNQVKGNIREKWGKLTNDDMDRIQGNAEIFIGVLQERYGYGREQAEREVNEFLNTSTGSGTADRPKEDRGTDTDREKRRRIS